MKQNKEKTIEKLSSYKVKHLMNTRANKKGMASNMFYQAYSQMNTKTH